MTVFNPLTVPSHSVQFFLMSRKPEFVTTFLTTAGVMLLSFHLRFFLSSAGRGVSRSSLWWTKLTLGGVLEKSDRRRRGSVFRT